MAVYEKRGTKENPVIITAKEFLEALADDECVEVRLKDCVIEGNVDIYKAGIEQDENGKYPINQSVICSNCTFKEGVNFTSAQFGGEANFEGAQFGEWAGFAEAEFGGEANFEGTQFGGEANFEGAQFGREASFEGAQFGGEASFGAAQFGEWAEFAEAKFSKWANFWAVQFSGDVQFWAAQFQSADFGKVQFSKWANFAVAQFNIPANFADVRYFPNTFFQSWRQAPTEFYLDSQYIDEVSNPSFKRYVADQQFIHDFKAKHHWFWNWLWRWSSDYGRSMVLWAFWSVLFALAFGSIYRYVLGDCFTFTSKEVGTDIGFGDFVYYSVVTFTTLGFGDIVPTHLHARIVVMAEVILGYVMLGGLISIFANKLARRS